MVVADNHIGGRDVNTLRIVEKRRSLLDDLLVPQQSKHIERLTSSATDVATSTSTFPSLKSFNVSLDCERLTLIDGVILLFFEAMYPALIDSSLSDPLMKSLRM